MDAMASRATGGTFAAFLISGAILGFAGGAIIGTQSGSDNGGTPHNSATAPIDSETDGGGDTGGSTSPDETDEPADDETPDGDAAITVSASQDTATTDE